MPSLAENEMLSRSSRYAQLNEEGCCERFKNFATGEGHRAQKEQLFFRAPFQTCTVLLVETSNLVEGKHSGCGVPFPRATEV